MTKKEKQKIIHLYNEGRTIAEIEEELGVSKNTIKSFLRRQEENQPCLYCKQPFVVYPGRKEKKFCSDKCRMKFWNSRLGTVDLAGMEECVCLHCGKTFRAYPKRKRKYCSHKCYIEARFNKAQ